MELPPQRLKIGTIDFYPSSGFAPRTSLGRCIRWKGRTACHLRHSSWSNSASRPSTHNNDRSVGLPAALLTLHVITIPQFIINQSCLLCLVERYVGRREPVNKDLVSCGSRSCFSASRHSFHFHSCLALSSKSPLLWTAATANYAASSTDASGTASLE